MKYEPRLGYVATTQQMTVCFLQRRAQSVVLLGLKKVGFGSGKYAGIGGKVEPGEAVTAAAVREVQEEIGVTVAEVCTQLVGRVTFLFPVRSEWNQEVYIFLVRQWQGEPRESDEMKPAWFEPDRLPYDAMWQDARHWIPLILEGNRIEATISFRDDNETVAEVSIRPLSENTLP
jgi:8-oxo-dGTP diphosphatase